MDQRRLNARRACAEAFKAVIHNTGVALPYESPAVSEKSSEIKIQSSAKEEGKSKANVTMLKVCVCGSVDDFV